MPRISITVLFLGLIFMGCKLAPKPVSEVSNESTPEANLTAKVYNSGFEQGHATFNGLSSASDGKIYYVLSTVLIDTAAQMFSFDPKTDSIERLGDLSEICGEKGQKVIAQGKSHVNFVESKGKLYFATHLGYYSNVNGKEALPIPVKGFSGYPGGHLIVYDMANKSFEDLGKEPHNEGIITMNMDTERGLIYGLSWPTGYLFRYDMARKEMKDLGAVSGKGEAGLGSDFRVVCRSIVINPEDGTVYMSNASGQILSLKVGQDIVKPIEGEDLVKDYFGTYEVSTPGSMAYNWRQAFWNTSDKKIYGVHGNSGYLFTFDPAIPRLEVLERLTSLPSKRSGMGDQFAYGYLGFKLGPDGRTIYYLTGGPIYNYGERVKGAKSTSKGEAKGLENLHLVTFDIPTGKYQDHGAIFYPDGERPLIVNAIAIGDDGTVYTTAEITEKGKKRTDLISFPGPFKKKN